MAGAPVGNKNAVKAKQWRDAIIRALARRHAGNLDAGLDSAADKLVKLAVEDGDKWAIDHIADRIDGKPAQVLAGDPDNPIKFDRIERVIVKPPNPGS